MGLRLVPSQFNGYFSPQDPGEPGRDIEHRLSVSDEEAWILSEFFRDKVVLEIGTGLGVSTRKMAETAIVVYTVDIDPWVQEMVVPTLPGNVKFFNNTNKLPKGDAAFEAAFIDGLHSYNQCKQDILTCKKLVQKGGMIVLHDLYIEGVNYAVADFFPYVHIRTKAGMALIWNN